MTLSQEARYLRARTLAYYAWQQSQPQYVIEGLDGDALDEGQVSRADATAAACLSSSASLTRFPLSPSGRGALVSIDRHRAARPPESQRGPVPEEAS